MKPTNQISRSLSILIGDIRIGDEKNVVNNILCKNCEL